jgi:site-specific recombinase XerD
LWPDRRFSELDKRHPAFRSYCKHLRRRSLSDRTVETYGDCLLTFARWLEEQGIGSPLHVTANDLEAFRIWLVTEYERRVSPTRQSTYIAVLRAFYRFLAAEQMILADPARALRYPKLKKRIHRDVLTPRELKRILACPDNTPRGLRDRVALRLLALSGPRVSELAGIDVEDVSLKDRELVIRKGKGSKQRLAFFDRDTQAHLARYLMQARPRLATDGERALVVDNKGRRADVLFLRRMVKGYGTVVRKAISPHSFRRTFCTLMLKAGANLKVISELAGHALLSTTARYTKVDIAELAQVYRDAHPRSR